MTRKNKLLIFGTMLIITTVGQAKAKNLKNENTAVFSEENEKEANDDIFIEFTEEKNEKAPDKNIDVVSYTNLKTNKKNKKDENKYVAFEQDNYGILAANLEELDEDYIVSSQVFELTGIKDSLEPLNRRMYAFNTQLDRKVLYPASRVYSAVVPKFSITIKTWKSSNCTWKIFCKFNCGSSGSSRCRYKIWNEKRS